MFDKRKVKEVANLAMIKLESNNEDVFASEISDFLKLVEQTNSLDLSGIEPMFHTPEIVPTYREDNPEKTNSDGINCSPDNDGKYIIVPKVIDLEWYSRWIYINNL